MTTYSAIPGTDVDQDSPVTQPLMQLLRDNPIAISEGSDDAPVLSSSWHPYDMVTVGDGTDGLFYDVSVSGSTATITTPTFADGYDYFLRWSGASPSSSAALRIAGVDVTAAISAGGSATGFLEIIAPKLLDFPKVGRVHVRDTGGSNGLSSFNGAAATPLVGVFSFSAMASALNSVSLTWNGGHQFDGGKFYLYRRRNFMFG